MIYSRELIKMIYFEAYGYNPVFYCNKEYVACKGIVLSSFRPVEVLLPPVLYQQLREAVVKKYMVMKSTSNRRVVIARSDVARISCIYDRKKLKQLTGKEATIPERVAMRVRTIVRRDDRLLHVWWTEVPSFLHDFSKKLILLALYYVRNHLGIKIFEVNNYEETAKIVQKLNYSEGILAEHEEAYVFVPMATKHVHYNDVRKAFISLKLLSKEEEQEDVFDLLGEEYEEEGEEESYGA